ncbi:hypothetical protein C362_06124 [Cryptococcus neoformans Bt1]|nr:hypothetical protein C362_06124 [Cryptococcus neoformans var. grubii Bt1]
MKNQQLVQQHYDIALKFMQEANYLDAWKNFDKAINFGGKSPVLLDCKATAMSKLPEWRNHALEVTKDMIVKWPKDFRGYYRQASVLYAMKAYDHAFKAISKAVDIGPTRSQNERQYKAIQQLRATIIIQKTEADRLRAANDEAEAQRQAIARQAAKKARINYTHLLSRDILLTIAEHGMADHPGFIFRMAGVCKQWRETLLNQPSLWNTIILGRTRMEQKVTLFIQRSRGRIKEVKITRYLDQFLAGQIGMSLAPYMPSVERLTVHAPYRINVNLFVQWRGLLRNVEYLSLSHVDSEATLRKNFTHDLLPPGPSQLRHLDISKFVCGLEDHTGPENDSIYTPLKQVETVSIRSTDIFLPLDSAEETLLSTFPAATSIELIGNRYVDSSRGGHPVVAELPNLRSYTNNKVSSNVFKTIRVPSLQDLSVESLRASSLKTWLSAPGLATCLTTLRSLDISCTSFTDTDVLSALAFLPGLQFLNVSACPLSNTFLEGLARRPADSDQENLCPKLIALSIAINDQITGGPLTRFVRSRVAGSAGLASSSSDLDTNTQSQGKTTQTALKKNMSSSFRPSARSAFGRPTKPPSVRTGSDQSISSTLPQSQTCTPSQPSSSSSSTLPKITWLNLDHCKGIDPSAISYIRKYVKFVGYSFAAHDGDRIAGKGKWRWDVEWKEGCGEGEGGCGLRRVAGTKDQWRVYHTCEPDVVEDKRGWTKDTVGTMRFGSPVYP